MDVEEELTQARARLLHDLQATLPTTPARIDVLEDVVAARREWVGPWPAGRGVPHLFGGAGPARATAGG